MLLQDAESAFLFHDDGQVVNTALHHLLQLLRLREVHRGSHGGIGLIGCCETVPRHELDKAGPTNGILLCLLVLVQAT